MMSIEKINLALTILSIVVTVVSVVFSIWSFLSAKKARQYKEEILQMRDIFDIEGLQNRFQVESKHFENSTRDRDWYKGMDINTVISPFKETIASFGKIYHLVKDPQTLKGLVHELNEIIQTYDKATPKQRSRVSELILEINEILQVETHNNTQEIIRN